MHALPLKQQAHIHGHDLEYVAAGSGRPVIVFVNGAGGPVEGWHTVYPAVARLGTAFAYNRLGVGGSDRPHTPQTGEAIVATLRALLAAVGLPPPYVLVGHSLGGLYTNLFARRFPHEVAGVVLLDAAAPGDEVLQHEHQSLLQRMSKRVLGVTDTILGKDAYGEVAFVSETVRQVAAAGPFPDVPLIVVSGGKRPPSWLMTAEAFRVRATNQQALSAMSPRSKQVIAARSGHFPQFAEPDLVIQAIREIVAWPQAS